MSYSKRTDSTLDAYEQMALLKQPNPRAPTGLRNLCIISIMLKAGLRVNEIINLKDEDFEWEEGRVLIKASGAAKERTLWLDKPELTLLLRWRDIKPAASDRFFCTLDGSLLQDRYIREMVKRLAKKAGITKDVYPHLLRYTFAVEFMRITGDIDILQEALGHRDASATQNYIKHMFRPFNYQDNFQNTAMRSGMPFVVNSSNNIVQQKNVRDEKPVQKESELTGKDAGSDEADEIKPRIILDDEPIEPDLKTPIPAIKCSSCNYILRYKMDCPKCGMVFNKIMDHWRRFI